jgi:hypothetical protein
LAEAAHDDPSCRWKLMFHWSAYHFFMSSGNVTQFANGGKVMSWLRTIGNGLPPATVANGSSSDGPAIEIVLPNGGAVAKPNNIHRCGKS